MSWKPQVSLDEAGAILEQLYGLTAEKIEALPGYDDANFYVKTKQGEKFTLKFAHFGESEGSLDMQNKSMEWLATRGLCAPSAVSSKDGSLIPQVKLKKDGGGEDFSYVRLLRFIEGTTLLNAESSLETYRSAGTFAARLDQAWLGFNHPSVRTDYAWDVKNLMSMRQYLPSLKQAGTSEEQIALVTKVFNQFEKQVLPQLHSMPSGVIHCDGNALNIIVDEESGKVKAFIDFGDVSFSNHVIELAILMAYCMIDQIRKDEKQEQIEPMTQESKHDRILRAGGAVLEGYAEVAPLSEAELQVLPCLIRGRLVTSVLFSAHTLLQRPEEKEYLTVDARPGWVLLGLLSFYPDSALVAHFRSAKAT